MSPELIDTHCHLNMADLFPNPEAEIVAAHAAGVAKLILVGVDVETSRRAIELAEAHESVFAVVGRHPNYAAKFESAEIEIFREMLKHPKVVALGEIGLDYHWDYASAEEQELCLRAQMDLALDSAMPVVFHCREAYKDLLKLLQSYPSHPYLFHCFAGDEDDAARVDAMGAFIGVDGPVTYKKADELREIVSRYPRDRVVLETDSPYLTPAPHRGKPNRPAYLPFVNAMVAQVWGMAPAESASITTQNARRFFRI